MCGPQGVFILSCSPELRGALGAYYHTAEYQIATLGQLGIASDSPL